MLRTPFYDYHVKNGARMVDFAGWEMPIMYRSILDEHRQVRTAGGMFDVSHMGRLRFTGPDAAKFLDFVCTRDVVGMVDGQARYGLVCNEAGGTKDDVLVYRYGPEDFGLVVNASNREKLLAHFGDHLGRFNVEMTDQTLETGMVALQGPKVMELMSGVSSEVPALKNYRFCVKGLMGIRLTISRTGYTGEDGVEVIMPKGIIGVLLGMAGKYIAGDDAPLRPAGLGARDTLRLEAAMPLYGHEMDEQRDPISAGLNFGINLDKASDFIGRKALEAIAQRGPTDKLVGLSVEGRRAARQGMELYHDGRRVGVVTSGALSPTLDRPIAMGYLPAELAEEGTAVEVDLGRSRTPAVVTKMPFYKRPKKA